MWNELAPSKYPSKYQGKLSSRWKVSRWTNLFCQILTERLKTYMANTQAPPWTSLLQAQLLRLLERFFVEKH